MNALSLFASLSGQIITFHPERILNPAPEAIPGRLYSLVLIGWAVFRLWPNCTNAKAHPALKFELFCLAVGTIVLRFAL